MNTPIKLPYANRQDLIITAEKCGTVLFLENLESIIAKLTMATDEEFVQIFNQEFKHHYQII